MKNLIIIFLIIETQSWAQVQVPFNSDQWKFETPDHKVEQYIGKESLYINKNNASLPGASFENGIIEYDVAFPEGRAFIGVKFRMQDENNYEEFYLRSHQSGNPDANQYTPVFGGNAAWQLYYGEGYGVPVEYAFNTWIHVKLVISGNYMEVYINDMTNPVMFSKLKRQAQKGYLGLGNFRSENHFANFTYTPLDHLELKGKPKPEASPEEGTITQWSISSAFAEKSLEKISSLKSFSKKDLTWRKIKTENTGTINLSAINNLTDETNTVLARIVVDSPVEQVKKFTFGFSDRARVYINDVILFYGEDNFNSRDYRFLGTIGYYDAIYLPLKKGRNEINIAVSESFGGWGIKGKFEEPAGINITND